MQTDEKGETQSVRTEQIAKVSGSTDSGGEKRLGQTSGNNGSFYGGTFGATGTRRNPDIGGIVGEIIAQLIKDAEDRLGKTRACIDWYQTEEKEELERLENLRRLQELDQQYIKEQQG